MKVKTHKYKKMCRLLAMVITLCLSVLALPIPAYAASQVYYNIDLSSAVKSSGVTQKVTGDCGVVSMATVEAYLYGATSSADKTTVYNAVVSANGDNDYCYWSNVGYVKTSYSMQALYDQLAQGYPVIVFHTGYTNSSGTYIDQHYSVVCGYTGSTSKLTESGFLVYNVGGSGSIQTLTSFKGGGDLTQIVYRKNGIAATSLSGIRFAINCPEVVHPYGDGHGVYGYVTSNNNLTNVTVKVVAAETGKSVFSKSVTPNAKKYSLYNLDSSMTFASWSTGKYLYIVTATDSAGNTKSYVRYFTISSSWPSSMPKATATISYNSNGGSGSMSGTSMTLNQKFTMTTNAFTRSGYSFTGWNVKRDYDSKWFCTNNGWYTESEISSKGYTKKLYTDGWSGTYDYSWLKDGDVLSNYTAYAQWEQDTYTLTCYYNYSGTNYLGATDFALSSNAIYLGNWQSFWMTRDESVSTITVDSEEQHNGYNSLKVVNTAVGSSGKDLAIKTMTQGNQKNNGCVGDNKEMILSFWAKSSVAGTKIYFRWGYESTSNYRSVTLTEDWAYYTVRMDKTEDYGQHIHPYIDTIGTVWLAEMQLEDGTVATAHVSNTMNSYEVLAYPGGFYTLPDPPNREGYTFDGWYTAASGGEPVTNATAVKDGNFTVYAHWTENTVVDSDPDPVLDVTTIFSDVPVGSWYAPYVQRAYELGLMAGTSETTFGPNGTTTRAMIVQILYNMAAPPVVGIENPFTDVPSGQWYSNAIQWAYENKITSGTSDTTFSPNTNVTREQIAMFLYSYYGRPEVSGELVGFTDAGKVSSWAKDAMLWATQVGILSGAANSDGTLSLNPLNQATRAEAATMMVKFYDYMNP